MDPRKRLIAHLVLQPRDLLVTVFMLNTVINILIQNVSSNMFGEEAGWYLKVGVPLLLVLFLGEIFPKTYGLQNNQRLSYLVAPSINYFQSLLRPFRKWIIALTATISRKLFFFLKRENEISKEELKHVIKTSEACGVLPPEESKLVWGYLSLQDFTVKELMHPREDMVCFDINDPLNKLYALFKEKKHARMPVIDKEPHKMIGIITATQLFLHRHEIQTGEHLKLWLVKPFYIPENTAARVLLKHLNKKNEDMAIAVDEYGSISGLITRQDIIQEMLGYPSESPDDKIQYTQAGKNEIICSGKLELEIFNEIFGSHLRSDSHLLTIGGWLTEQLNEIPKSGTKYKTPEFLFHVLAADPSRIRRIYIRKLTQENSKSKPNSKRHSL